MMMSILIEKNHSILNGREFFRSEKYAAVAILRHSVTMG